MYRAAMRYFVTIDGTERQVDVQPSAKGDLQVTVDGKVVPVDVLSVDGALSLRIDGKMIDLTTEGTPPALGVVASGRRVYLTVESERVRASKSAASKGGAKGGGLVSSPMPGRVLKVLVNVGDEVAANHPLIVVEAMKMENELRSPGAGVVKEVFVKPGDTVEGGAKLIRVEG